MLKSSGGSHVPDQHLICAVTHGILLFATSLTKGKEFILLFLKWERLFTLIVHVSNLHTWEHYATLQPQKLKGAKQSVQWIPWPYQSQCVILHIRIQSCVDHQNLHSLIKLTTIPEFTLLLPFSSEACTSVELMVNRGPDLYNLAILKIFFLVVVLRNT